MSIQKTNETSFPDGPDELVGFTEAGKSWVGILVTASALALLVWSAILLGS